MGQEEAVRAAFRRQAETSDALGSAFMGRLCRALAEVLDHSTATGRAMLDWQGDVASDLPPIRLCGGLNALVLSGADPDLAALYPPHVTEQIVLQEALPEAIVRHDRMLLRWLAQPPQTNEIARSGMLLPGFLAIARETGLPLDLIEIGASAGLNLPWDRFRYQFGSAAWGDPASAVQLQPELRGPSPDLGGRVVIAARHAADIMPVNIRRAEDRLRLRAYVWPDQTERLRRLDASIRLADGLDFAVEAADAADFVERRLASRRPGSAFVLYHSIMWHYLPGDRRRRIEAALADAGRSASSDAPIAWLRMEPQSFREPHALLSLTQWPGGAERTLARCDYHGRWIEMLAG